MTKKNRKMNRTGAVLKLCLIATLLLVGCAEDKSKLTEAEMERIAIAKEVELVQLEGGLVLLVEGETLTSDDLINESIESYQGQMPLVEYLEPMARRNDLATFKKLAYAQLEEILMSRISNILLYQHAKREAGESEQMKSVVDDLVEKEWRQYVLRYGGDVAKADAELLSQGMTREEFKEEQRKRIITQGYIASKFPRDEPVTYSELKDCYERVKDREFARSAKFAFRLIDINVMQVRVQEDEDPIDKARKLADEIMNKIRNGADFGELAKEYSHGHRRSFGGLWDSVSPDSLARPYDIIVEATKDIEVGQVAGPIDTGGHIFVIKLEERQPAGYEPFEQVQRQVARYLRAERSNAVIRNITSRYLDQASLGKTDQFIDFCLEKIFERHEQ